MKKMEIFLYVDGYRGSYNNICLKCLYEITIESLKYVTSIDQNNKDVIEKELTIAANLNFIEEVDMEIGDKFLVKSKKDYVPHTLVNKYHDPDLNKKGYVGLNEHTNELQNWPCAQFYTLLNKKIIIKEWENVE